MTYVRETIARTHQNLIDNEVRATRRAMLDAFRDRLISDPGTLAADDFLAIADRTLLHTAIIIAAQRITWADAADLQLYDAKTKSLVMTRHRGFPPDFISHFAAVDADAPSACGLALATDADVVVDDVSASPVFADHRTRDVVLAAGSRAVRSYPLRDGNGGILGMLSVHFHVAGAPVRAGHATLVRATGTALAHLDRAGHNGDGAPTMAKRR